LLAVGWNLRVRISIRIR